MTPEAAVATCHGCHGTYGTVIDPGDDLVVITGHKVGDDPCPGGGLPGVDPADPRTNAVRRAALAHYVTLLAMITRTRRSLAQAVARRASADELVDLVGGITEIEHTMALVWGVARSGAYLPSVQFALASLVTPSPRATGDHALVRFRREQAQRRFLEWARDHFDGNAALQDLFGKIL